MNVLLSDAAQVVALPLVEDNVGAVVDAVIVGEKCLIGYICLQLIMRKQS